MNEQKLIYPFDYLHHRVATVALYGTNNPLVVVGNLVLRTYYTDDTKKNVDIDHTSEYVMSSFDQKIDENADPKVQIQQAVEGTKEQHR